MASHLFLWFILYPSLMNNELERMCKAVVIAQFEVPSWNLFGGSEENGKKFNQVSRSKFEFGTSNYRGVLPT
jgi:hypothetical protein